MRQGDSSLSATDEEADDEEEGGGGYADGEGDPCPNCGRVYKCDPMPGLRMLLYLDSSYKVAQLFDFLTAGLATSGYNAIFVTPGMMANVFR